MAEAHQARVQHVLEEMVQNLEKENIRQMQGRMFRCSAACCDRTDDSLVQVHRCIEKCHTPLAQAQGLVTSEIEKFQDRLTRCTLFCNDKAKDLFESGAKEPVVRGMMDRCVGSCVDEHIKLLPGMAKRVKENLTSIEHSGAGLQESV